MRVLTENNKSFDMNNIPDQVDDIRFCVLDYSNSQSVDYFFLPLVFLESFTAAAADIQVGPYRIQVPLDWSIVIGEKDLGDAEVIPISQCMDRDFSAFSMNPIRGFRLEFLNIELVNVFPNCKWYFPKLKNGHILCVPLEDKPNPRCIYVLKDAHKIPDILDISKLM